MTSQIKFFKVLLITLKKTFMLKNFYRSTVSPL
jgi:hypothetical protein